MNHGTLVGILGVGLLVGFGGRWVPSKDALGAPEVQTRVDRLDALTKAICLPAMLGQTATSPAKLDLQNTPDATGADWVDLQSRSFVSLGDNRCRISIFESDSLSRPQAIDMAERLENMARETLPALEYDPGAAVTDENNYWRAWMTGPVGRPERWGIGLLHYGRDGTVILFTLPPN